MRAPWTPARACARHAMRQSFNGAKGRATKLQTGGYISAHILFRLHDAVVHTYTHGACKRLQTHERVHRNTYIPITDTREHLQRSTHGCRACVRARWLSPRPNLTSIPPRKPFRPSGFPVPLSMVLSWRPTIGAAYGERQSGARVHTAATPSRYGVREARREETQDRASTLPFVPVVRPVVCMLAANLKIAEIRDAGRP